MRSPALAALAAWCAVCALAACAPADRDPRWRGAGNATPRDGGTLRFAVVGPILSLDPTYAQADELTAYATHALFDTLVAYEPVAPGSASTGQRIVPALAERWDVSADGLVYTFALRAGLAYSDGTPVVADDFRAQLERVLATPDAASASLLGDIAVAAPDARTLVIRLAHPNASFLAVLTLFATPQPAGRAPLRDAPLGTGPFELAAWTQGTELVLRKNPRYWNAAQIHLDAIEIRESVPIDMQFLMFETGELDAVAYLAPPDLTWIEAQPAWAPYLRRSAQAQVAGSRMNVRVPPFDDRRVRQAFNYAVDKQHVVTLLQGAVAISHGPLPPGMLGRDETLAAYPHDPAKARALLAEAGFPDGLDVEYVVPAQEHALRVAASLRADLAEVGVRVHERVVAPATWEVELASAHGAPFMYADWLFDYPDPASVFESVFATAAIREEGSTNSAFYGNPELDALLAAARGERDPAARAALFTRADRIVHDDAPWLWSHHRELVEAVQPYVMGYAPHPAWPRDFTRAWLDLDAAGERVPR